MIRKKKGYAKPVVDLDGPDGNAFVLLGMAKRWARDLGIAEGWDAIRTDATSGDYEHLLAVLDEHFGDYVIFERGVADDDDDDPDDEDDGFDPYDD